MAELFKKPSLQATVSPAGWRSIKVQTQQAPVSPLIDLANTLNVASQVGQQYAGLQAFEYKQGVKEGEIAAASADLDEAIEGLDTAGEQLVEQGLMPRSQLFGYQKGFRKHIGQREAKSSFYTGLQGRLKEVEMNPENGNYDVIDQIITEEETNSLERLRQAGGSELALQGFSEFSSEIKDRFKIQATEKRDKVIQRHNEDMYIQGFNQDFGDRILNTETVEDAEALQVALKTRMDEMVANKIPRSRVVELFWNGFAVPNIRGLLAGDDPQPEKAERILDHLTKIDLTGKKGFLGNINREGAAVRSSTATFRDQIAQAREKIEADVDDVAKRIVNEYTIASNAIQAGVTGNEEIDNRARREIARQLQHAGYSPEESMDIATDVYDKGDVAGYTRYLSRFLDSDVTREAFGKAARSFGSTRIQQLQLSSMYLTNEELPQLIDRFEELAKTNPTLTSSDFLSSGGAGFKGGPIMDKKARAAVVAKELELDKKKWWENSEAKKVTTSSFGNSLRTNTEALYMQQGELKASRAQIDQLVEPYEAEFKTKYETLIKEAADKIDPDNPNREELMLEEERKISNQLQGRWKRLQETLQTVGKQARVRQASKGFDPADFNKKLEQAERDLRDLEPFWAETVKESLFGVGKFAGVFEEVDDPSITIAEKDYAFREMTGATSPMRAKALEAADKFDKALLNEPRMIADFEDPDAPAAFKETSKLLRKRFGYSSINQVPDFDPKAPLVDWRMTPVVAKVGDLRAIGDTYIEQLTEYHKLPLQEQNIEDAKFTTLRKMRNKFGIFDGPTEPDEVGVVRPPNLMIFIAAQRALFNK
jgi:hypothetical protein